MKIAIASLESTSPYSQARYYKDDVPALPKENDKAYEQRTWRHRMHVNKDGYVVIPGMAFANCIKNSAGRLKMRIGKGRVEYTKYFQAGVMCTDGITTTTKAEDAAYDQLMVPSDGRPGGLSRVTKLFPRIDEWKGKVTFYILDDIIPEEIFVRALKSAGALVGIGRFRPEKSGFYGRFVVNSVEWSDSDLASAAE